MQHFICFCCLVLNTSKMKYLSILLIAAVSFVLLQCKKPQKVTETIFIAPLNSCSNIKTDNSGDYFICVDSLNDSRCPANAICIWAGFAMAKIKFHEGNNTHSLKMVLEKSVYFPNTNDTTINGYRIIFTDVQPYPGLGSSPPIAGEQKCFFKITH